MTSDTAHSPLLSIKPARDETQSDAKLKKPATSHPAKVAKPVAVVPPVDDIEWKKRLRLYGFVTALVVDDAFAPVGDDEITGMHKAAFIKSIEDNNDAASALCNVLGLIQPGPDWEPDWEETIFSKMAQLWRHQQAEVPDALQDALRLLFDGVLVDRIPKRKQVEQVIRVLADCGFTVVTSHTFDSEDPNHLAADILFVDLYVDRKITDGDTAAAVRASAPIAQKFLAESKGNAGSAWRSEKCLPPVFVISSHQDVLDITAKMIDFGIKRSCIRSMHKSNAEQELKAAIKLIESYAPLALKWQAFKNTMISTLRDKMQEAITQLDDVDVREVALLYKATIEPSSEDFEPYLGWLWGESISARLYETGIDSVGFLKDSIDADLPIVIDGKTDIQNTFVQLYEESSVVHRGLGKRADEKYAAQVSFGDLFVPKADGKLGDTVTIYAIMTRACDVVRAECSMNLLCRVTDATKIKSKREVEVGRSLLKGLTRSIQIGPDRYILNFAKDTAVQTIPFGDINNANKFTRIGRLSPLQALQMQQMLLSDFGKVGTPSALGFLEVFDAEIRVLKAGKMVTSSTTPALQFYSAIAYKYRNTEKGADLLKVTFTSAFVTFLKDLLNGLAAPHDDVFKLLNKTLLNLNNAALNAKKFELDVSGSITSASLISDENLRVYITGEPVMAVDVGPVVGEAGNVAAAEARQTGQQQQAQTAKPKAVEIAILLTPKTIETVKVTTE